MNTHTSGFVCMRLFWIILLMGNVPSFSRGSLSFVSTFSPTCTLIFTSPQEKRRCCHRTLLQRQRWLVGGLLSCEKTNYTDSYHSVSACETLLWGVSGGCRNFCFHFNNERNSSFDCVPPYTTSITIEGPVSQSNKGIQALMENYAALGRAVLSLPQEL